jgi:hypothetical protein
MSACSNPLNPRTAGDFAPAAIIARVGGVALVDQWSWARPYGWTKK